MVLPVLDLVENPFTERGSRLLVTRYDDTLRVSSAEYERPLDECRVLRSLRVEAVDRAQSVLQADAAEIRLPGGAVLAFAGETRLVVVLPVGQWHLELGVVGEPRLADGNGIAATDLADRPVRWRITGTAAEQTVRRRDGGLVVGIDVRVTDEAALVLDHSDLPEEPLRRSSEVVADARRRWTDWMARRPVVRADLAATADLAWWTLGANQLRLSHDPSRLVVAPSKLGYVAAWQWDSYFVAAGLRHGATDLAWDQLAVFLDHQQPDGSLPDVVFDNGMLATVADLPQTDRQAHRPDAPPGVPVTKPPLAAWALWKLHQTRPDADRLAWAAPRIARSHDWWDSASDPDGDGLAEYLHPYSSGLDDSPLFDLGVPAQTPDLNSYLVTSDDLLGRIGKELGDPEAEQWHERAAGRMTRLLAQGWDDEAGRFVSRCPSGPAPTFTPFHLMPLLTGRLPEPIVERLVTSLRKRLWIGLPVPTVAPDEPEFDPDRMWRGPIWLNVNRLLVEGLQVSGRPDVAAELAEQTLALVVDSGGLYEHWNPLTGARARTATSCFAWSAALFIDLAASRAL